MTNSQEMQLTSLDRFRLSEESSSPSVSALVSKLNSSLAASNLFCKDTNNGKGNSSTNQNDKGIEEILPWLSNFNNRCRSAVGSKNIKLFESLLMLYLRNIGDNVKSCYLKPNRAAKLKSSMYDTLIFFHLFYKDIQGPFQNSYYLDKMSVLVSMYIDMEFKASRRIMKKKIGQNLSRKLTTALYVFLDNSIEHILDAILKSKFFTKNFREIAAPILGSVLNKVRVDPINEMLYVRYILAFKLWKKIIVDNEVRKKINKIALQQLHPPKNFIDKSKLYSKVLPWISKRTNVTHYLMQAKFNLKSACQAFLKMVNDNQQSGFSSNMVMMDKPLYFGNRDGLRFSEYDQIGKEDKSISSLIDVISESIALSVANAKASFVIGQETISSGIGIKRKDRYYEKSFNKKIKREKELIPFNSSDYKKHKSNSWLNESDMLKKFSLDNKSSILLNSNNFNKNKIDNVQFLDQNKLNYESDILNIVKKEPTDYNEKQTNINHKLSCNNLNKQEKTILKSLHSSNLILKNNKLSDNGVLKHNVDFAKKHPSQEGMNSELIYRYGSKQQNKKLIKENEKKFKNSIKQKKNKAKEKLILKDIMKEKTKLNINVKEKVKKKKLSQNQKREASPATESSDIVELVKSPIQAELITIEESNANDQLNTKQLIKSELEDNSLREKTEKTTISNYTSPPPSPPIHRNALEKIAQSYHTPVLSPCEDNSCDSLPCNEIKNERQIESNQLNNYSSIHTPSPSPPYLCTPVTLPIDIVIEGKLRNSTPDQLILKNKEIHMKSPEEKEGLDYPDSSDFDTIHSGSFITKETNSLKNVQNEIGSDTNMHNLNDIDYSDSNLFKTDQTIENSNLLNLETKLPIDHRIKLSSSEKSQASKLSNSDSQFQNNNSISVNKIHTKFDNIPPPEIKQILPQSLDIITPENSPKKAKSKAIQTNADSSSEIKPLEIQDVSSFSSPIKKSIFSSSRNSIDEKKSLPFLPQQVISLPKKSSRDISSHSGNAFNKKPESKSSLSKVSQNKQNSVQNVHKISSDSYSIQSDNVTEIHSSEELKKPSNEMIKQSTVSTSLIIQTPDSSTPVDNQISHSISPKIQIPDSSTPMINQISEPISSKSVSQISSQNRNLFNRSNSGSDDLLNLAINNEIHPDSSSQILSDENENKIQNSKANKVESYQLKQLNKGFSKYLNTSILENEKEIQNLIEMKEKCPTINKSEVKSISNKTSCSVVENSEKLSSIHPLLNTNKIPKVLLKKLDLCHSPLPSFHSSKVDSEEKHKISEEKIEANTYKQTKSKNNIRQKETVIINHVSQEFSSSNPLEDSLTTKASLKQHSHKYSNEMENSSMLYYITVSQSDNYNLNKNSFHNIRISHNSELDNPPVVNTKTNAEANTPQDLRMSMELNSGSKDTEDFIETQYGVDEEDPLSLVEEDPSSLVEETPLSPDEETLLSPNEETPLSPNEETPLSSDEEAPLSPDEEEPSPEYEPIEIEKEKDQEQELTQERLLDNGPLVKNICNLTRNSLILFENTDQEPTQERSIDQEISQEAAKTTDRLSKMDQEFSNFGDSQLEDIFNDPHISGKEVEIPDNMSNQLSYSTTQGEKMLNVDNFVDDLSFANFVDQNIHSYPFTTDLMGFSLDPGISFQNDNLIIDIINQQIFSYESAIRSNDDNTDIEGTKRRSRNYLYNQLYRLKRRRGFLPDSSDDKSKLLPSERSRAMNTPVSILSTPAQTQGNSQANKLSLSNHTNQDTSGPNKATQQTNTGMCWNSNPVKHYPKWQPQNWPQPTVPVPTFNSHHVKCNCRDCTVRNFLLNVDGSEQIPTPQFVPVPYEANLSEWAARKSEDERLLKRIEESLFNTQDNKDCSLPLKKRLKTMLLRPAELPSTSKQPTENLLSYPSTPMISIAELDNSILIKFPQRSNDSIQNNSNKRFPCIIGQNEYYSLPDLTFNKPKYTGVESTVSMMNQSQNDNTLINQIQNTNALVNQNNSNELFTNINNEISTNGTYVQNEKLHSKSKNPENVSNVIDENVSNVIDENVSPSTSAFRPSEFVGRQFRTPAQRKEIPPSTRVFNNIGLLIQPELNKSQNQITVELNQIKNNYSYGKNSVIMTNTNEKEALDLTKTKKHKHKHSRRRKSHSEKNSDQVIYNNSKKDNDYESDKKKKRKHESGNR